MLRDLDDIYLSLRIYKYFSQVSIWNWQVKMVVQLITVSEKLQSGEKHLCFLSAQWFPLLYNYYKTRCAICWCKQLCAYRVSQTGSQKSMNNFLWHYEEKRVDSKMRRSWANTHERLLQSSASRADTNDDLNFLRCFQLLNVLKCRQFETVCTFFVQICDTFSHFYFFVLQLSMFFISSDYKIEKWKW